MHGRLSKTKKLKQGNPSLHHFSFSSLQIIVGFIALAAQLGHDLRVRTKEADFLIVGVTQAYNAIFGRATLNYFQVMRPPCLSTGDEESVARRDQRAPKSSPATIRQVDTNPTGPSFRALKEGKRPTTTDPTIPFQLADHLEAVV
ncbi:hypothetical protein ACLOJK_004021 [Asimina triloba]